MLFRSIAAEKGIAQAQRFISREYLTGEFLPKSYQEAKRWMEAAAEQGDEEAQIGLGKYYVSGFGFDDDQRHLSGSAKLQSKEMRKLSILLAVAIRTRLE